MERIKERKKQRESHENEETKRIMNQKYTDMKCEEKNDLEKQIQNIVKQQIENKVKSQKGITLLALVITIALNASRGHNEKLLVSKMQNESKKEESANKKL